MVPQLVLISFSNSPYHNYSPESWRYDLPKSSVSFALARLCRAPAPLLVRSNDFSELPSSSSRTTKIGASSSGAGQDLQTGAPICSIWHDFRQTIPSSVAANDSALPSSRLGTAAIMGGQSSQGCVPAHDRLGPFGHSSARNMHRRQDEERPWSTLRWGTLQEDCADGHAGAQSPQSGMTSRKLRRAFPGLDDDLKDPKLDDHRSGRTAVVLRTWDEYEYYPNQMAWMRAMITELSLDTGGRFQVFILVDAKHQNVSLSDDENYADVLNRSVPPEFRDMALLFDEELLREWYPEVGEYGAQDQMYQALQIFSYTFPEFDYIWQLEMDARFTGNVATALSNVGAWADQQPRKNLWERNARWYIPGLWRDYSDFAANVDREFSEGQGVWGPHENSELYVQPQGPSPPDKSDTLWGIGEPAELITFAPLIDPVATYWTYEHTVHGFDPLATFPRRMAIISMTRTSRRLLRLISAKQRATGAWVVSESTPETWTLLHGLKAVYAPHLVTFDFEDGEKSPEELDKMVHKGPPESLAGGQRAGILYCGNYGGLTEPRWLRSSYFFWIGRAPETWWDYTNGTCAYPMLLHPVKAD
nr:hypothetical protein CFP56_07604 [Quercus suber]